MKNVVFDDNSIKIHIQCNINDKMENIFNKYSCKTNKPLHSLSFAYQGNKIDEKLTLDQILDYNDKESNEIKIMVLKSEVMNSESLSKKKSKQVICPTCGGPAQIKIKNYKISIYECENQHKKDDLNLDEFVNSQFINEKNIICDECKYNTKEDSYNNKFFFCNNCKLNLCPLCNIKHKGHDTIDYDNKFSKCGIHNELFSLYCKTCHKNICTLCEQDHEDHEFISFGKLVTKKKDLENKLEDFKISLDKFSEDINRIKDILQNVYNYCQKFYKVIDGIAHNFDIKNRNYQNLCNIKEIFNEDISKKLDNIINSENYTQKINEIFKMYNSINNKKLNIDGQSGDTKKMLNESKVNMENIIKKEKELMEEISKKNLEIEKLHSYMPLKLNHGENLMTVIFISDDQKVHYSFICKNTDKFKDLESKLYEKYPEYSKTENYFLSNGRTIIKSKDLDFNKIKNSDIITLYCDEF